MKKTMLIIVLAIAASAACGQTIDRSKEVEPVVTERPAVEHVWSCPVGYELKRFMKAIPNEMVTDAGYVTWNRYTDYYEDVVPQDIMRSSEPTCVPKWVERTRIDVTQGVAEKTNLPTRIDECAWSSTYYFQTGPCVEVGESLSVYAPNARSFNQLPFTVFTEVYTPLITAPTRLSKYVYYVKHNDDIHQMNRDIADVCKVHPEGVLLVFQRATYHVKTTIFLPNEVKGIEGSGSTFLFEGNAGDAVFSFEGTSEDVGSGILTKKKQ
jgi:hypothetical protein